MFSVPGAACLAATAATDHFKSKGRETSLVAQEGGEASRERCSVLWVCYQKKAGMCFKSLFC